MSMHKFLLICQMSFLTQVSIILPIHRVHLPESLNFTKIRKLVIKIQLAKSRTDMFKLKLVSNKSSKNKPLKREE